MDSDIYRIVVLYDVPEPRRSEAYNFLNDQFDRIKGNHPADQLLNPEQYDSVLAAESTFMILCVDQNDSLAGATLITSDVNSVDWASGTFFDRSYANNADDSTPIFFVAALAVAQTAPPQVLNGMIDRLTDIVADADGVAVADLADQDRNYSLARHIAARVAMRYESDWQSLGSQTYHAFRPGERLKQITPSAAKRLISNSPVGPGVLRNESAELAD